MTCRVLPALLLWHITHGFASNITTDRNTTRSLQETRLPKNSKIPTTDEVFSELKTLEKYCPALTYVTSAGYIAETLDYVRVQKPTANARRVQFMVFGLHPREMITVSSALHFIKRLCDKYDWEAQATLEHTHFIIFPNANPISRRNVENGNWGVRTNEFGVDVNQNFDVQWDSKHTAGARAFSEYQSRIIKEVMDDVINDVGAPQIQFFDVHSGHKNIGFVGPRGFGWGSRDPKAKNLKSIFKEVKSELCTQCTIQGFTRNIYDGGAATDYFAKELNYAASLKILAPKTKRRRGIWGIYDYFVVGNRPHEDVLKQWSAIYLEAANEITRKEKTPFSPSRPNSTRRRRRPRCADKAYWCENHLDSCSSHSQSLREYMSEHCPKSCREC